MKQCTLCRKNKDLKEFYRNRARPDGRSAWCRECELDKRQGYYADHPEGARRASSKFRKSHLQQVVSANMAYRHANKDKEHQWNQNRPLAARLLNGARGRARKRNLPCTITVEDILIPDRCPVLGIPLVCNRVKVGPDSPSLDCTIPEKGYIPGNVAVMSFKANTMKSNATLAELRALVNYLAGPAGYDRSKECRCEVA